VSAEAVRSLRQVVHDIAVREGVAGLFKGAMPSILKAAPSAAVTFMAYEFFLHWLSQAQAHPAAATATKAAAAGAAAGGTAKGEGSLAVAAAQPSSSRDSGGGSSGVRRPLH